MNVLRINVSSLVNITNNYADHKVQAPYYVGRLLGHSLIIGKTRLLTGCPFKNNKFKTESSTLRFQSYRFGYRVNIFLIDGKKQIKAGAIYF